MALCPDHGGYTGDACRKCQSPDAPVTVNAPALRAIEVTGPPKLDDHDRLTLTQLENISLKSFHRMQNAQAQFQNFAQTMFEKYKVKPAEYTLDMEKLEFVSRSL